MDITNRIEYIYVTIPKQYICLYHRLLVLMADYGVEMLKDCKASCTDRNSTVIECFNMFNAAVAARKLSNEEDDHYDKLANLLINYIEAKLKQLTNGADLSTSFTFPIDENGEIKALVSCGETVQFTIDEEDGELYAHKFGDGKAEHFSLGVEDFSETYDKDPYTSIVDENLEVEMTPHCAKNMETGDTYAHADIVVRYNNNEISLLDATVRYYFDGVQVSSFSQVVNAGSGEHEYAVVVIYNGYTKTVTKYLKWN